MEKLYEECDRELASLKAEWDALMPDQQEYERWEYEYHVVSSYYDAFDHQFHPIFAGLCD
ncbi:hypothetical protein [uncultured Roseobacter sp.]|uniref:hypothetical protein n=1 Tax=uncultured Roseobacter sp. TaxID=114847 RepID=UPI002633E345|nr:hypothetical protein [uncultured Roseobacter sp.]